MVRLRVLIVDDNPGDRFLMRRMLTGAGTSQDCSAEEAWTLAGALERLATHGTDLILLDLYLPDSAGTDTISRVRQAAPSVPIVVVTGTEDREAAVEALVRGAQDFLVKGKFDAYLLNRAIARQVSTQQVSTQLDIRPNGA